MMKLLSFKITSVHLLLCVFLSLLWGATNSNTTSPTLVTTVPTSKPSPDNVNGVDVLVQSTNSLTLKWDKVNNISTYFLQYANDDLPKVDNINASSQNPSVTHVVTPLSAGKKYEFILFTTFNGANSTGYTFNAPTAPHNAQEFKSIGQNETSITLRWNKVDAILNYILAFNGKEIDVTAAEEGQVTHTIPGLSDGTKYDFRLFTVFENVRSSGVDLSAVTAPRNAEEFQSVGQTETSITLRWNKVDAILNYILAFNGKEINVTAAEEGQVTHIIPGLSDGTKYDFRLFTVFENVRSSGVDRSAVTAPRNAEEFQSVGQTETSIILRWNKVDAILNYILAFNGKEINVTAAEEGQVTHTIPGLSDGTKYDFRLFTVFENVSSSGVDLSAVTAPRNAEEFQSVGQTETSITLRWNKVDDILNYILAFNGKEINVTAAEEGQVTHIIPGLSDGTKYDFRLFTVFENVRSSGVDLSAVTAPPNAEEFQSVGQTETSITLRWNKVDAILNYILAFNGKEINVTAAEEGQVTHTIPGLSDGTKYDFRLFTVFENVPSSGVDLSAVTAPRNAEEFQSVGQNETSITLRWNKVDAILNYILAFNGKEINVTAAEEGQVTHTIPGLSDGTKYDFRLFTVFENVRSSGVDRSAVTAPRNAEEFQSVGQNETSITLRWNKVDAILNYILVSNGSTMTITASTGPTVTHTLSGLTSMTKYNYSLFTMFENVRSSGVDLSAVTAPPNIKEFKSVGQNETSITLQWNKVDAIVNYILAFNGKEINITAAEEHQMTYIITGLISGTKYTFSLFAVFESAKSSGINHNAVTAPENVKNVIVSTQNESSITLKWDNVYNITTYILQYGNDGGPVESHESSVTHVVSSLKAGTKYDFSLTTVFENVNSTGFFFNAITVPSTVDFVNVTTRSVTDITLEWNNVDINWSYFLQIDGKDIPVEPSAPFNVVSRSVTSLHPGTKYPFSVITVFSGLNSTAFEGFTVTAIDCTSVNWHVTNSSIQGTVQGLFTKAIAISNLGDSKDSTTGSNVLFKELHPGATYKVSLVYEENSIQFPQCDHVLTIYPPDVIAHCEYWAAGYAVRIVFKGLDVGVWTAVEVNMTRGTQTYNKTEMQDQRITIDGLQPAKTYEVSTALISGTLKSWTPYVFQCHTDPRGVIAGSVIAILLFGVLVCLAVFILLKRPDIISRKNEFIGVSRLSNKKRKAVSIAKFPDHFYQLSMDENRCFSVEYESLLPVGTEQTRNVALLTDNKAKNRFTNVLPYDWSRVKLSTSNPNGTSDYINASYMPGYNSNREYIATQGPLPTTVNDFWRMIWEQRVKGIVMVTNCTEGGRIKCEQYWPRDSHTCLYGELKITISSEQQDDNWTLREFRVKRRNTSEERTVKHFHFTAWPDHGVPQGTKVLINFRELIRQYIMREGTGEPTVVHCSAGVGRTGTIISLDVLLQQLEKERAVDINAFVRKLRLSRPHMVQTESQYIFLHQCIMDCLQPNEKPEDNIYENMIYVNGTALQDFS